MPSTLTHAPQPASAESTRSAASASQESTSRGDAGSASQWQESPRQLQQGARLAQLRSASAAEPPARGGLPEGLQRGIETLSGMDMSGVRVHRNSAKPAALQAHAYAQGQDIHLGPGQEKHLPHEAWHVVQQAQGRVKPTRQMKRGVAVNDDAGLEREADVMGARALGMGARQPAPAQRQTAESRPLVTAAGTLLGVAQCVGDKVAFKAGDVSAQTQEIQDLATGVAGIYANYKAGKKAQRNQLDLNFTQQTSDLELRQTYLIKAIEMSFFQDQGQHFVHNFSAEKIKAEGDKRDTFLVDHPLPDAKKYGLLAQGRTLAQTVYPLVQTDLQERADENKKIDIKALNTILYRYSSSYGRHAIADPIVQGYEKGYKASGVDYSELVRLWTEYAQAQQFQLTAVMNDDIAQVDVVREGEAEAVPIRIATVYFNDQRFERAPLLDQTLNPLTPQEEVREVYKHRESGQEYVQDAQDIFVKRHVSRALNKYDNPDGARGVQIDADPRKKTGSDDTWAQIATQIPGRSPEERDTEIRNHQRAKEAQGGSPFVSFTTTSHPIFGSSAKLFESDRGVATVDLARISKSRVFDTHTDAAMERIHEVEDPDPTLPYAEGDDAYERNSAARDAMRTRELVVAGDIPLDAITAVRDKNGAYARSALDQRFHRP
ncbi:DUF4157 domain-containing protein [Roseateles flavus]|uniref:DUF4157 domain-containing protein n=1 Tax=Roseateles flavus TaxID=3149041 RepID=A0ABV0GH53_9BURK